MIAMAKEIFQVGSFKNLSEKTQTIIVISIAFVILTAIILFVGSHSVTGLNLD
jgi:hypothetical protein